MTPAHLPDRITDGDFRGWLRDSLAERRMSQRVLAMRTGVHHSTISRLLSGDREPSLATALAMIEVLSPLADVSAATLRTRVSVTFA